MTKEKLMERVKQLDAACSQGQAEFHINRGRLLEAQEWLNQVSLEDQSAELIESEIVNDFV